MKLVLTIFASGLAATPLMAHSGAHLHPHFTEGWIIGAGFALICVVAAVTRKVRK